MSRTQNLLCIEGLCSLASLQFSTGYGHSGTQLETRDLGSLFVQSTQVRCQETEFKV